MKANSPITYKFFYEEDGEDGWSFEVKARDHNDAFEKAYDTHGPQVKGMMYYEVESQEKTNWLDWEDGYGTEIN